eukprot:317791-Chlamydomonas_euryale.AAC.3
MFAHTCRCGAAECLWAHRMRFCPSPHQIERFSAHVSLQGGWVPWVPARLALEISQYSPQKDLPRVAAPVLFVAARRDTLCPADIVRRAAAACAPRCRLLEYDVSHFGLYGGHAFEDAARRMAEFYLEHMPRP